MLALTSPYLWYTSRATGLVALVLFTVVVSLGSLVANRVGGGLVGRFEINELHRSVSMLAIVFLVLHITTTVVDSFVPTGLISVIIPMTSSYRRLPVALGAVALDLFLAVWISSLLKARLANQSWRFIHWFSWLGFATSIVHALLVGTDSRQGIGLVLVLACSLVVGATALWRFLGRPARAAGRTALSPIATTLPPTTRARPPKSRQPGVRPPAPSPATSERAPARSSRPDPVAPEGAFPRMPQPRARKKGRR